MIIVNYPIVNGLDITSPVNESLACHGATISGLAFQEREVLCAGMAVALNWKVTFFPDWFLKLASVYLGSI